MRSLRTAGIVVGLFLLHLDPAFAQGSITGVIRDSTGNVIPGVTVEATSPVLIEKVRTAMSDENGVYRIVNLSAGRYSLAFKLAGFSTYKRDGIEVTGDLIASVNVDMRVGEVAEVVTVTGETPVVDVQSVRRQTVIDSELIAAIPAARTYAGLMTLMPNTVQQGGAAANTQVVPQMVVFGTAGGRTNEGRVDLDGLSVGSAFNGAGVSPRHLGRHQRQRGGVDLVGRAWRSRSRRSLPECRAQGWWKLDTRKLLRVRRDRTDGRQQLHV